MNKIFQPFEVNEKGINKKISVSILDEDSMRKLGFTDYDKKHWYYCRKLKDSITFNLTINKQDQKDFRIDVLDDNFCQPYDYQAVLMRDSNFKYAKEIFEMVEEQMARFSKNGIVHGHEYGEYI